MRKPVITLKPPPSSAGRRSMYELKFVLSGTDVSMANAIRRIMIAEVPTMAVDSVTVNANTSPLHDEYIAHRLGLIPLGTDRIDEFAHRWDCEEPSCEGECPKCAVHFKLTMANVEGPTVVTSTQFRRNEDPLVCSDLSRSVYPVHDSGNPSDGESKGIIITRLAQGQVIDMDMVVRKGIGKDHAKWSPVCTVAYRITPPATELVLPKLNDLLSDEAKEELVKASEGLLRIDEEKGAEKIFTLKYETPFLLGRIAITPDTCRKACALAEDAGGYAADVVRYNQKPKNFEFNCETTGALPPKRVLLMGLNILRNKLDGILQHLGPLGNDEYM